MAKQSRRDAKVPLQQEFKGPSHAHPPEKPTSSLANKPIIIWLTLLVALLGAAGGIPSIIGYFFNGPEFAFTVKNQRAGVGPDYDPDARTFLVEGVVVNKGEKPLLIDHFLWRSQIANKGDSIYWSLAPFIESDMPNVFSITKIGAGDAIVCGSDFSMYKSDLPLENRKVEMELVCVDVAGKEYSCKVSLVAAKGD